MADRCWDRSRAWIADCDIGYRSPDAKNAEEASGEESSVIYEDMIFYETRTQTSQALIILLSFAHEGRQEGQIAVPVVSNSTEFPLTEAEQMCNGEKAFYFHHGSDSLKPGESCLAPCTTNNHSSIWLAHYAPLSQWRMHGH